MRSCCSSVGSPRLAGSMCAQLRPARGENTARRDESQARAEHFSSAFQYFSTWIYE